MKETPNLNEMSDPHREEFITKSRLHDWQKAEVRKANDKTAKYLAFARSVARGA